MTNFIKTQQAEATKGLDKWRMFEENSKLIDYETYGVEDIKDLVNQRVATAITNTIKEVRGRMEKEKTEEADYHTADMRTMSSTGIKLEQNKGSNAYRTHVLSVLDEIEL